MSSQNYDDYMNDSSNWAQEGYGIFEYLQLLRKPKAEQEAEKARLAGACRLVEINGKDRRIKE